MSQATTSQTKFTSSDSCKRKSTSEGTKTSSTPNKSKSAKSDGKKKKEMSKFEKQWLPWRKFIRRFRKDLQKSKPVVDDRPPLLSIVQRYDPELLKADQKVISSFYSANPEVLKLLHNINVFGGRTETFKYDYDRLQPSSNYNFRKADALMIEKYNKNIKAMIESTGPRLPRVQYYAKFWKQMEEAMEFNSEFPLFWKVKEKKKETIEVGPSRMYFKQYVTEKSAKYPDKRPRVVFEIAIKNVGSIGKMVAVLFSDYVPMTVKNFLAFCNPKAELTYKGCSFYLIFQNFFCQTGDVVENKGFGGTSIYGPYFGDEDHTLQHGVLTMFNTIPNRNQCQFLITFRELKTLNGTNVVFGKIIRGFHVLDAIESVGSKKTGRPKVDIYISHCDEI